MNLQGQTLGNYQVLEEIGRGGMAVVYRAYQPSLNRTVAIKVLPPDLAGDRQFVDRFQREARAAANLHHPHIVVIHDVAHDRGVHYIVMEYLEGRTLNHVLEREGPLPLRRAVRIAEQVASALDYAHARRVVHRDVKPANIFVGPGDRVTLTDFGIAKALGGAQQLTRTGAVMGTPEYMAPEQAAAGPVDHRADLYALGVVLYQMLTGRVPFRADTPVGTLYAVVHTPPPSPRSLNAQVPPSVEAVVLKALAKNPASRFQTGGELIAALRAALTARPQRSSAGWPVWLMGGSAAVLLLALAGLWLLASRPARQQAPPSVTPQPISVASPVPPTGTPIPAPTSPPPPPSSATQPAPPLPSPAATLAPPVTATAQGTTSQGDARPPSPTAVPPKPPPGPVTVFADGFDGTQVNPSRWQVDAPQGKVTVAGGVLQLRSSKARYPYLYTRSNPFPAEGAFRVRARFRYLEVKDCGTGIILTSCFTPPGVSEKEAQDIQGNCEANGVTAGVWQDIAHGLQLWYRSGPDRADVPTGGLNVGWNELLIEYSEDRYGLSLNGARLFTSPPTPHRPRLIWLGHPAQLAAICWWDTFELDEISVERLP